MGHLAIVNEKTLQAVLKNGCISTGGKLKGKWKQSTSDLFADALCIRKGDPIFAWVVKGKGTKNKGFQIEFTAAGGAYHAKGKDHPIEIPITNKAQEWQKNISEEEALDLFEKKLLWNAIGKKSLGRGKSLTHQTTAEDEELRRRLTSKSGAPKELIVKSYDSREKKKITIDELKGGDDEQIEQELKGVDEKKRLGAIQTDRINWVKGNLFFWQLSFGKRPPEELYRVSTDPFCMTNLSEKTEYAALKKKLMKEMVDKLKQQQDPRIAGNGDIFDRYEYAGEVKGYYERYLRGEIGPANWVEKTDYEPEWINRK